MALMKRKMAGVRRSVLGQRVWLQSDRDLLLGRPNSLLSARLLRARRVSGNGGYSGRIIMDLAVLVSRGALGMSMGDVPRSSRSGDVK